MKTLGLEFVCELPSAPDGYRFVTTGISLQGELLCLFVEESAASQVHRTTGAGQDAIFPVAEMDANFRYLLIVTDGAQSREVLLPRFNYAFPIVDLFPDGRVVIVGARCGQAALNDGNGNGLIYDPRDGKSIRFLAGDGIENIGVDGKDQIWVSYFDEGVFSSLSNIASGLNCFDASGNVIWKFQNKGRFIDDCYALNVTPQNTYFYYYSDFDLGTISDGFNLRFQEIGVAGCHCFAIMRDAALFGATYDDPPHVVNLIRFGMPRKPRKFALQLPDGSTPAKGAMIGRGSALHYISNDRWYRLEASVAEFAQ